MLGQPELQTMFTVGTWYIWWERRQFLKEEKLQSPSRTAMAITILAANYSAALKSKSIVGVRRHGWQKPPEGIVKLNVDASFQEGTKTGATGAILRDAKGFFIGANNQ